MLGGKLVGNSCEKFIVFLVVVVKYVVYQVLIQCFDNVGGSGKIYV